ncbi:hypothetical protein PENSPDRAFT_326018 [Peniophora sp. CONT]|nr:hypothetical protein PENSPDRAFT_326018 [Peniophora sp. CONT]
MNDWRQGVTLCIRFCCQCGRRRRSERTHMTSSRVDQSSFVRACSQKCIAFNPSDGDTSIISCAAVLSYYGPYFLSLRLYPRELDARSSALTPKFLMQKNQTLSGYHPLTERQKIFSVAFCDPCPSHFFQSASERAFLVPPAEPLQDRCLV